MEILTALIEIRKCKKVEQKVLSNHLGITQTTLSRYETGKREMPLHIAVKYASYIDCEIRLLVK